MTMITTDFKKRVIAALKANADQYPSDAKQARAFDINPAQLSRLKKGELERVVSDAKWISLGRKLEIDIAKGPKWETARTPAFEFIWEQLSTCQDHSIASILVDMTDLGKTHTAKAYAREKANCVYVDCSQVKSKQLFVRKIATEFGLDASGKYVEVYQDLTYYLRSISKPLVILDEAGDLKMEAFLEVKALWNATERACGWFMLGADGLKAKMEKQRALKKVGFAETFRRYGSKFQKVSPDGGEAAEKFKRQQFAMVAQANGLTNVQELYRKSNGSLERCRIEYEKLQRQSS